MSSTDTRRSGTDDDQSERHVVETQSLERQAEVAADDSKQPELTEAVNKLRTRIPSLSDDDGAGASESEIVWAAVDYIKSLQDEVEESQPDQKSESQVRIESSWLKNVNWSKADKWQKWCTSQSGHRG